MEVEAAARERHSERWAGECRDGTAVDVVALNAIAERDDKGKAAP